jgi:hypothetical protein
MHNPLAGLLADLSADLRRGCCCLLECDKGWALPVYAGLKERLAAAGTRCGYLDGRVKDAVSGDSGVMVAAVAQMRWAVRAEEANGVSREVIPLLYENPESRWLGFCDPSLRLPDVVQKVFARRYVFDAPFRPQATVRHLRPPADAIASDDAWGGE